jgi:hypothetical protein
MRAAAIGALLALAACGPQGPPPNLSPRDQHAWAYCQMVGRMNGSDGYGGIGPQRACLDYYRMTMEAQKMSRMRGAEKATKRAAFAAAAAAAAKRKKKPLPSWADYLQQDGRCPWCLEMFSGNGAFTLLVLFTLPAAFIILHCCSPSHPHPHPHPLLCSSGYCLPSVQGPDPSTVARVRELLDDIVRRELVADVPKCVLLSGGLDSSAITALAARDMSTPVRSFSVEFTGQAKTFTPSETHPTLDAPYVHDVARYVGSEHTDIVIDHRQLSDPAIRRKVVAALDLPTGGGEQDASLYLLFKAIRERSTVALSGEAADEIFGGYRQFHDPRVQGTDAFPWIAIGASWTDPTGYILTPEMRAALGLETYLQDRYVDAVAEVERLATEDDFTHRMRVMSYLHLTRFVRILLDRNDRMSMAVGLEVRVPFCDHRLVEYVYNTPWSMKSYDGREKSLLRGAVRDVLPESVVQRVKSRYPSTSDPLYGANVQAQARELLTNGSDTLFCVVDRHALEQLTRIDAESLGLLDRFRLERVLDLSVWIDLHQPSITV